MMKGSLKESCNDFLKNKSELLLYYPISSVFLQFFWPCCLLPSPSPLPSSCSLTAFYNWPANFSLLSISGVSFIFSFSVLTSLGWCPQTSPVSLAQTLLGHPSSFFARLHQDVCQHKLNRFQTTAAMFSPCKPAAPLAALLLSRAPPFF